MLRTVGKALKFLAYLIVLSFVGMFAYNMASVHYAAPEPGAISSEQRAKQEWATNAEMKLRQSAGDEKEIKFDELTVTHAWNHQSRTDPMSGKVVRLATIEAKTNLHLRGRDGIDNTPTITIRRNPDKSIDAMVQINRGQFVCRVSGCQLSVRFDEAPPVSFNAVEPADYSSKTLFLVPGDRFLKKLERAKVVRVEATLFQEGNHVMEFHVAGLKMP